MESTGPAQLSTSLTSQLPPPSSPTSRLDQLMRELLQEGERQKNVLLEEGKVEKARLIKEAEEAIKAKTESVKLKEESLKKTYEKAHKKLLAEAKMVGEEVKKASGKVKLDVGGRRFTTTYTTLCSYPQSMLAAMFSGRHDLHPDEDGYIFIDRDGDLFAHILRWLRSGILDTDNIKQSELLLLKKEAEYYQLPIFPQIQRRDSLEGVSFPKLLEKLRQHEPISAVYEKKKHRKKVNPCSNSAIEAMVHDMIEEQTVILAKEFNAKLEEEKEEKLRLVQNVKTFILETFPKLVSCAATQHIAATKKRILRSLDTDFQPNSSAPSSIETCDTPTHPTPDVRSAMGDSYTILSSVSIVFAPALDTLISTACTGYDSQVRSLFAQKILDVKSLDNPQNYTSSKNFVMDDSMYTALSFRMTRALLLNDLKDNHDLVISITCMNCRLMCHGRYSTYKWSMGYESDNQYRQCGRNTIVYEVRVINPYSKEEAREEEGEQEVSR